jgi:hypothetical protein
MPLPHSMPKNPTAVKHFLDAVENERHKLHSLMLLKGGSVGYEAQWNRMYLTCAISYTC